MPHPAHLVIRCPTCGAEQGERCRTVKTGRSTGTHSDRIINSARIPEGHPSTQRPRHLRLVR